MQEQTIRRQMKISPDHDHEVEGEIEEIETNFDVNIKVVSENKSNSSQIKDQKHEIMVGVEDPKDVEGSEMEIKVEIVPAKVVAPLAVAENETECYNSLHSDHEVIGGMCGNGNNNGNPPGLGNSSPDPSNSNNSNKSLLSQSEAKISSADKNVDRKGSAAPTSETIRSFFKREHEAFKEEKTKYLRNYPKKVTNIDFDRLINEFKVDGVEEPERYRHWHYQAQKKDGEKCPELFSTIMIGLIFTLAPNCAIVLDYMTASEYIGGNYYLKYLSDWNSTGYGNIQENCRNITPGIFSSSCKDCFECLEFDPIYGALTLLFTFISGIFWSSVIFYRLWHYLLERDRAFYDRKRILAFCFIPLSLLCIVTFPLQLFIISLIAVFNDQNQWTLLTIRIGIAEGLFNAHSQFLLQLFVFFQRADRHPSIFQYLTAFGSLLFLSYSRVESLLLDRDGHKMSPGQRLWWIIRYAPGFLLNCAFKLGSISLIAAMLRFNCIWIYLPVVIIWALLQILFNEQVLPRSYYHLFLGAGMHAISVAHVQEEIKLINTDPDVTKNILFSTRLTSKQLRANLRFQNMVWFLLNSLIIITMTVFSVTHPDSELHLFWPFTPYNTYTFQENKVFRILKYIAPILISIGLLSQVIIWWFEERAVIQWDKNKGFVHKAENILTQDEVDDATLDWTYKPRHYEGWTHLDEDKCPGCTHRGMWHKHAYCESQVGAQSKFSQIVYPLLNIWENFGDKNTTQT